MQSHVEDVVMQELLSLQVAELQLAGKYNILRSTPAECRNTRAFKVMLAELDSRVSKVERLLEQVPTAVPVPRQLVA
jgi:hypothetical protein